MTRTIGTVRNNMSNYYLYCLTYNRLAIGDGLHVFAGEVGEESFEKALGVVSGFRAAKVYEKGWSELL
jgi:hypothetical protein